MADARNTISHYNEYDYVIINDNLEIAFEEMCALIEAKRFQNIKKSELDKFAKSLMEE